MKIPAPIAQAAKKADQKPLNLFAQPETIPSLFGATPKAAAGAQPANPAEPDTPNLFAPKAG